MDNTYFYPIHGIIPDANHHGVIVGKNGSLTYVVKLSTPEVYSLCSSEIENWHKVYIQAFSHMPDNSYIHKQDIYEKCQYKASGAGLSYLAQSDMEYFSGREYLRHTCMLAFTLNGLHSLSAAYTKNIFSFNEALTKDDSDRLADFLAAVQFAINNLSNLRNVEICFLDLDELKDYVFSSTNFYESQGVRDIHFSEEINAGKYHARIYAITNVEFFSNMEYPVAERDDTVSRDRSELYMSPAESFGGIHLNCNHVYNQVIYFYSDKLLKDKLQKNLDDHTMNKSWDKVNMPGKIKMLTDLATEISENKEILCYAHYSILLWDEDLSRLELSEKEFRSAMDIRNINYYIPSYGNLAEIYAGGIIGCTASLRLQYMFMTSLSMATTFLCHYSTFKNDPEGVFFNDRLTQIPLRKDIWDAKKRRIHARNSVVIAPTGSGKSFFTNNIVHQILDQGYTVVAVEFGNSFKQLCYLYPDLAIHIEYDPDKPLGINSFDLEDQPMTPEKEDLLITLCLRFWRKPDADANTTVALRKLLGAYYKERSSGHSFQDFYTYITDDYPKLCVKVGLKPEYFDIDSFQHVCSEFMPGGTYANLCVTDGVASKLADKRFIHFELTKVKANPFVASVVMSLLFDMINNKILSDSSKKGYIVFDEYAETAQLKTATSLDVDIHQTVAIFYQKIRKENGAVMTIIQTPDQLPDNEFTKGIIGNTQILYVLPGIEVVLDAIIKRFMIKNQAHINQMKSIQNNYKNKQNKQGYSECWIRFGDNYAITVRLEVSLRKYLAFQTEGEIRSALDKLYNKNGHDMQKAIEQYIENSKTV